MSITINIEWLFFIVPFFIAWVFSLILSDVNSGWVGSPRAWYWMLFGPMTLVISFASWGIYLRWFK